MSTGSYSNISPPSESRALVPDPVSTRTVTRPGLACTADVHTTAVLFSTLPTVPASPKVQLGSVPVVYAVPRIVTSVPPPIGPRLGLSAPA